MRGKDSRGEHCFVLNTGAKIPAIGLGTWQSGGDICIEAVTTALKFGYRHIDCSHLYGNEVEVGKALAEAFDGGLKREDLFLTSKLYFTSNSHKRVENSVRVSLENLGVSYLDLYLVHWPESSAMEDATDPPWNSGNEYKQFLHRLKPTWKAVESLVEMGLVRAIGISNFTIQQIKELLQFAKIVPAVNQVELHPFWRQDELVKFCQQSGIHVSAHTPLGVPASNSSLNIGSGFSDSGSEDEPGTPRITFRRSRSVHGPMLKLSVVADIAEQHMKTPEQPISNFTRSNEANSELAKMNGTSSPHWDASLRTGTPTPRERNEMRSLSLFEEELHLPASVRMQSCFIHPLCWNAKLLRPHEAFSLHGNVGSKDERQETKRITEFGGTPVDAA